MSRVIFVTYSLRTGGAERIMSYLANFLVTKNISVYIITINKSDSVYKLSNHIKIIELGLSSTGSGNLIAFKNFFYRVFKLYITISKINPHLCISFMTENNIITIIAGLLLKVPVIISERTNPIKHKTSKFYLFLRAHLYKYASALVVQTNSVSKYYSSTLINSKIFCIPNFINLNEYISSRNVINNKIILNIGRLSEEKGHLTLLHSFAKSDAIKLGWKLRIIGVGPLETELKKMTEKLGIFEHVDFYGKSSNIILNLNEAGIFILTSRYEGFPNSLMEALASGVPSISTNCDFGPNELINDGVNGFLAKTDDVNDISAKINLLINDQNLRNAFSISGPKSMAKFDFPLVINRWYTLIVEKTKK